MFTAPCRFCHGCLLCDQDLVPFLDFKDVFRLSLSNLPTFRVLTVDSRQLANVN